MSKYARNMSCETACRYIYPGYTQHATDSACVYSCINELFGITKYNCVDACSYTHHVTLKYAVTCMDTVYAGVGP